MDCLSSSILQFPKKKSNFECSVHRYVCRRFQLEEDTSETDLYKLAVASILQKTALHRNCKAFARR